MIARMEETKNSAPKTRVVEGMERSVTSSVTTESAFPKNGCVTVKGTVMPLKMKKTAMVMVEADLRGPV